MEAKQTYSQSWLDRAYQDLYSAECLMEHHPAPYEVICNLCQQAVEKSLKGVLALNGEAPPRSHDCGALCSQCALIDPQFSAWMDQCSRFDPFGVIVRYPNELDVEESDARWALAECRKIYDCCMDFHKQTLVESQEQAYEQGQTL